MSIKDSNFNLQMSMSVNKSCDSLDYFGFTDLIRKKVNEDDINLKIKQVREVTNCNEEFAITTLHDCNYNVEYAINKIITHEFATDGEWKTKKGKQKKIVPKEKDTEKNQDVVKEKNKNSSETNIEKDFENGDKKSSIQMKKDFNTLGKTFKNYNLTKRPNSNFIILEHRKFNVKPEINFSINGKWNDKSIIIENSNFTPMPIKDIMMLKANKNVTCERQASVSINDKKDQEEDSSIVFKTHCTTKPPPKVLCSLVAPVQIINQTIKPNSLPKFKFGDTDFNDDFKKPDSTFISDSNDKTVNPKPKFVDIEDNSIIKVGPSQKISNNQSRCSYSPDILHPFYNHNPYIAKPQSNLSNNIKSTEFNIKKPNEMVEFSYVNVHPNVPTANISNCNLSSMNTYNLPMSQKEINNNPTKQTELFLNNSPSLGYSPQANMNHVKSTIYLVPNVMMNPMNGLYMSVNNPIPSSALSPPMAPLPSQYNAIPQPHPQVYFEEPLQHDELVNKNNIGMRPFNQGRNYHQRFKKTHLEMSEDHLANKPDYSRQPPPNMKNLTNLPLNQNAIPKQISFNYPYIIPSVTVASHNHSQMFLNNNINSNSFSHYQPANFPTQDSNSNDVRKRNIQIQNSTFQGKGW